MPLLFSTTPQPITHPFKLTPIHKPPTQSPINHPIHFSFFHSPIHPSALYPILPLLFPYFTFHKPYPRLLTPTFTPLLPQNPIPRPLHPPIHLFTLIPTLTPLPPTLPFPPFQINEGLH
ncbi:BCCT family transporter, partial [Staphylococcus aureus]|uniref:BCCT family transporter n=1 Tax=Staphylococcus aureus TaxID=1280 RepID=UPI0037D9E886